MRRAGKEPFPVIYQDAKAESEAAKAGQLYEVVAKAQLKKQTKMFAQEVMTTYRDAMGWKYLWMSIISFQ